MLSSDSAMPFSTRLSLADFGSAVVRAQVLAARPASSVTYGCTMWQDQFSASSLYSDSGPSHREQTLEYAPPESLFSEPPVPYDPSHPHVRPRAGDCGTACLAPPCAPAAQSFDMWSAGVVFLEVRIARCSKPAPPAA